MARKRSENTGEPVAVLREHLASGVTGRVGAAGASQAVSWGVYVMQGDILAAHSSDDGNEIVHQAINRRILTTAQAREMLAAIERDGRWEEHLVRLVPDDQLVDLLSARFRQNLLDFLSQPAAPEFEPLEAVFVDNIQVGHDSRRLIVELCELRDRIAPLAGRDQLLTLSPGPSMPSGPAQARIVDLVRHGASLEVVIGASPFERGETLSHVRIMLDQGVIVSDEGFSVDVSGESTDDHESGTDSLQPLPVGTGDLDPFAVAFGDDGDDYELDTADFDGFVVGFSGGFGPDVLSGFDEDMPATEEVFVPPAPDEPLPFEEVAAYAPEETSASYARLSILDPELEPEDTVEPPPLGIDEMDSTDLGLGLVFGVDDDEPSVVNAAEFVAAFSGRGNAVDELPEMSPDDLASPDVTPPEDDEPISVVEAVYEEEEGLLTHPEFADEDDFEELAVFADHDIVRGAEGQGEFIMSQDLLDVVDLSEEALKAMRPEVIDQPDEISVIEMADAEDLQPGHDEKIVALAFSAPRLDDAAIRQRLLVCNSVLGEVATAIDSHGGPGSGQTCVQLLLDGAPTSYAVLFRGVEADGRGCFDLDHVFRNLKRRPEAEHRGLLNRGLMDLIERALSYAVEELPDGDLDGLLGRIAGYQQRLRS